MSPVQATLEPPSDHLRPAGRETPPPAPPRPFWKRPWFLAFVVAPLAIAAAWFAFGRDHGPKKEQLPPDASVTRSAVMVTAEPVNFRDVRRVVEAVGTLHAYEEVIISAKVEGRVKKIHFDTSARVRPGETLLEIDPTDAQLAVAQAEKTLQVELSRLGLNTVPTGKVDVTKVPSVMQAQARLDNAHQRLDRIKGAAESAVSPEERDLRTSDARAAEAEYQHQVLQARMIVATSQMKHEALRLAQQQLRDTKVVVPAPSQPVPGAMDLRYAITSRAVAEGTLVRPGTELFKLVIDQTLKLRARVPERFTEDIRLGQTATIQAANSAEPFNGTVTRINPDVNPTTRTFEVEIQVPNPHAKRKPGSFAKTAIVTRVDDGAPTVPLESVVSFAGVTKIFLVEDGTAKEVNVKLGVQGDTWVEIARPLIPRGAAVVKTGQSRLSDGVAVEVRSK